jgi:hypothetical protein
MESYSMGLPTVVNSATCWARSLEPPVETESMKVDRRPIVVATMERCHRSAR